jgi:zinc protease
MTLGGVGNFSVTNLRKVLAGKRASASPSIGLITQGMNGSSSIQDFETMLQLVYLYFTAPRSDKDAFDSYIQRMETRLKNQEVDPMVAFSDSVTYALYGDNPMTKRLKVEDLPNIDYEKIMEMYKQSFGNPGSFTFSFVGNIDEEKVKPIIEQYLASLPGTPEKTEFKQIPMDYRKGIIYNLFERQMQIPKASVFNGITGSVDFEQRNQMLMSILGQILDIVYTEKIREEEGGTYGVYSGGGISRYPKNQSLLQIMYDTDPAKMEKMNAIVLDELQSIADNGPRETDFSKVKEFMRKKYYENIKENSYWLNILNNYYFYGDDNYSDYLKILESITSNDVKTFTKEFLSQNNRATVIMMPKE